MIKRKYIGLLGRKCANQSRMEAWAFEILVILIRHFLLNKLGGFTIIPTVYLPEFIKVATMHHLISWIAVKGTGLHTLGGVSCLEGSYYRKEWFDLLVVEKTLSSGLISG